MLAWVSYTGDFRLPVGSMGYEDNKPFGPVIDQATFDGKDLAMNGYDRVREVIKPLVWFKPLKDGRHDFVPDGRSRRV